MVWQKLNDQWCIVPTLFQHLTIKTAKHSPLCMLYSLANRQPTSFKSRFSISFTKLEEIRKKGCSHSATAKYMGFYLKRISLGTPLISKRELEAAEVWCFLYVLSYTKKCSLKKNNWKTQWHTQHISKYLSHHARHSIISFTGICSHKWFRQNMRPTLLKVLKWGNQWVLSTSWLLRRIQSTRKLITYLWGTRRWDRK